jgi:hypothetical protein
MTSSGMIAALLLSLTALPALAVSPADKCEAAKLKTAGKLQLCQAKALARAISRGTSADTARCDGHFAADWQTAETAAGGACPSSGDRAAVQAFVTQQAGDLSAALAGGPLLECPAQLDSCSTGLDTCTADLTNCSATPTGQRGTTGQTACYDAAGTATGCTGSGQDGEHQAGLAVDFTDNGNGTITDRRTGLTWEKMTDDGTIHDKDQVYTWSDAVAARIVLFNAANFGGYNDWRLPNVNELQSLADYGASAPAVAAPFDATCTASCASNACSCTAAERYWTASSRLDSPGDAWVVSFDAGAVDTAAKSLVLHARAGRGGL